MTDEPDVVKTARLSLIRLAVAGFVRVYGLWGAYGAPTYAVGVPPTAVGACFRRRPVPP